MNVLIAIVGIVGFSIEDLNKYIIELKNEINRVKEEISKKERLLNEAQKFFK